MAADIAREAILVVEDDEALQRLLLAALEGPGRDVAGASTQAEALAALAARPPDVVVLDLLLGAGAGVEVLKAAKAADPDCMVIAVTGHANLERVNEVIRAGAVGFLGKPFDAETQLVPLVAEALRRRREARASRGGPAPDGAPPVDTLLVGKSPAMVEVFVQVSRLAASDVTVLVSGETGTGKELVARALHRYGPRPGGPFVVVDCASLPPTLIESELFGHKRGAFSGADADRAGRFEAAEGGTVFLDEIGNVPLDLQPKLLRALQERTITRVGANQPVRWNARVVCATNADLKALAAGGKFREDLLFRLQGASVRLPPLRDRLEDLPRLAGHFLAAWSAPGRALSLSAESESVLRAHRWPGNVRELEQALRSAAALAPTPVIRPEDLPAHVRGGGVLGAAGAPVPGGPADVLTLDEVKRRYVRSALQACQGNQSEAARRLGIDRSTIKALLERDGETE